MARIKALFQQMAATLKDLGKTCFQKIKVFSHLKNTLASLLCLTHAVLLVLSLLPPNHKTLSCDGIIISFTLPLITLLLQSLLLGDQKIPCDEYDALVTSVAVKLTDASPQKITQAISKAPSSNAATVSSGIHAPKEPSNAATGAGLENLWNTCFMNAILQCLTHTVPLVQYLLSGNNHQTPCDGYKRDEFCVVCHFQYHIVASLRSAGRAISPTVLVDNLSYFSSYFKRGNQEDAHEFMHAFLDKLDCCYQDSNPVQQIFGGRAVSKLRCCQCNVKSEACEPGIDLSLAIEGMESLVTALESHTMIEKIEDVRCAKCIKPVTKEKQLLLEETPSVAVFHLNRFKNDGYYLKKIDKHMEFPLELELLPYTSGIHNDDVELIYDLYGIVVHEGSSPNFGHYYCFVRTAPGTWFKFNDSQVAKAKENEVLAQKAYILFYAKQGTPWFSSYAETLLPYSKPSISNTSPKSVLDNVDSLSERVAISNDYGTSDQAKYDSNSANSSSDGLLCKDTNSSSVLDNIGSICNLFQRVASSHSCGTSDQDNDGFREIEHKDNQPGRRANGRDTHKMKYMKPMATFPKPFRLRTAERCLVRKNSPKEPIKEENLKQKREAGLKTSIGKVGKAEAKKKAPWKI